MYKNIYIAHKLQTGSHFLCEFSFTNMNFEFADGAPHLDVLLPEASEHYTTKVSHFLACSLSNFYTMIFLLFCILPTPVMVRNERNMQDNEKIESQCNHTEMILNYEDGVQTNFYVCKEWWRLHCDQYLMLSSFSLVQHEFTFQTAPLCLWECIQTSALVFVETNRCLFVKSVIISRITSSHKPMSCVR